MKKRVIGIVCLLLGVLMLCACGAAPAAEPPAPQQSPVQEAEPVPAATPEPTPEPEPTPDPDSPEGRAAALGLPAPPDVDVHSWEFMLANSYNSIAWYDLKDVTYFESQGLDPRILDATKSLISDAREQGLHLYIAVSWRNQEFILNRTVNGRAAAKDAREFVQTVQPLGSTEHQTGLAIDFTDDINYISAYYEYEDSDPQQSETYQWLMAHCADYGFIYRYPDKPEWYGLPCRHWHFRYVGTEAARYIMDNGLCLEEFLVLYDPDLVFFPEHGKLPPYPQD